MVRYINRKVRGMQLHKLNEKSLHKEQAPGIKEEQVLTSSLDENIDVLRNALGEGPDIIIRKFSFGQEPRYDAAVIFVDGMVNKTIINDSIIKPLMYDLHLISDDRKFEIKDIGELRTVLLSVGDVKQITTVKDTVRSGLYGNTILLLDGHAEALDIDTKGWETRSIQEPSVEQVVRGPREGFTETMRFNTAMLRRKILNPNFTIEQMVIGEQTRTNVSIAYLRGVANPKVVEEVKTRLGRIKTDAILESGYIEEFIEDAPYSIFSTVGNTEKPDVAAAKILEGRIAILVDGTPFVLTVPMLFVEGFQSAEDYYSRPHFFSFIRMLRFMAFFISMLAPAIYVALTSYHQELIPTPLLITIAAASEGTPFPALLETLVMVIVYEILQESGIRLPSQVGQALSIVGALVMGQAAVEAGLVGAPVVIVVAITAIASFLVVTHTDATALLRYFFIILAGVLGAFGIIIGLLAILIHLAGLRSFGSPYLSPLAPITWRDLKDVFIRVPIWAMDKRPQAISVMEVERQAKELKPQPPEQHEP